MSEVDRVINELVQFTGEALREYSFELVTQLIFVTPRDTGWAQSGWVVGIGSPIIENFDKVRPTAELVQANVSRQNASIRTILDYSVNQGRLFLTNNVPYLLRLNDGSSTQAPPMFIEDTIEAITESFNSRSVL